MSSACQLSSKKKKESCTFVKKHRLQCRYFQNAHSLRNKSLDLKTNVMSLPPCPDVFVFTETWLTEDILNGELGLSNFNIYRLDRSDVNNPQQTVR